MDIGGFINSAKRIFIVSKKPTWKEFNVMVKVTSIGIVLIGILAYIIYLLFQFTGVGF